MLYVAPASFQVYESADFSLELRMHICDWICENQPSSHKNLNSFF